MKRTATPALRKHVFRCRKCEAVRTIECLGRVVLAPVCSRCGLRMKPMAAEAGTTRRDRATAERG